MPASSATGHDPVVETLDFSPRNTTATERSYGESHPSHVDNDRSRLDMREALQAHRGLVRYSTAQLKDHDLLSYLPKYRECGLANVSNYISVCCPFYEPRDSINTEDVYR